MIRARIDYLTELLGTYLVITHMYNMHNNDRNYTYLSKSKFPPFNCHAGTQLKSGVSTDFEVHV